MFYTVIYNNNEEIRTYRVRDIAELSRIIVDDIKTAYININSFIVREATYDEITAYIDEIIQDELS